MQDLQASYHVRDLERSVPIMIAPVGIDELTILKCKLKQAIASTTTTLPPTVTKIGERNSDYLGFSTEIIMCILHRFSSAGQLISFYLICISSYILVH